MTTTRRRRLAPALGTLVLLALAGCAPGTPTRTASSPAGPTSPSSSATTPLTISVYGAEPVVAAYRQLAEEYTARHPSVPITVRTYATHDEAEAAQAQERTAGDPPDLFLIDRDDLAGLDQQHVLRRVDDLLGERQVDFGDGYTRNGLEAFSYDSALKCMPADVSPLVVYYNPRLVDLNSAARLGRGTVDQQGGWTMDEFTRAAQQVHGLPGKRGVYVAPTIDQVAPFVWSAGGQIVDDNTDTKSLSLSDPTSAQAVERVLELVRDPTVQLTQAQVARSSALERFENGQLGMILGYRDLVPQLRAHPGLLFDVMPMPRISSAATNVHMTGLCLSSASRHVGKAADFLTYLVSRHSAQVLAATGYVMPPDLTTLNSDVFLQPTQLPLHAGVFVRELRHTKQLPDAPAWPAVEDQVGAELSALYYDPVIDPLQTRLQIIDQASMPVFDPRMSASPSPSTGDGTTGTPTGSPGASPDATTSPSGGPSTSGSP